MNAQTQDAIIQYSAYQTPQQVMKYLREKYGDNAYTYNRVYSIREKYRKEILDHRRFQTKSIPILDAQERWIYLQNILDGAMEEKLIPTKWGDKLVVNYREALQALKLAHEMTQVKGVLNEEADTQVREIIFGAFDELKNQHPKKEKRELVEMLLEGLPEEKVKPYISELLDEQPNTN